MGGVSRVQNRTEQNREKVHACASENILHQFFVFGSKRGGCVAQASLACITADNNTSQDIKCWSRRETDQFFHPKSHPTYLLLFRYTINFEAGCSSSPGNIPFLLRKKNRLRYPSNGHIIGVSRSQSR